MPEQHTLTIEIRTRLDQILVHTWDALNRQQVRQLLQQGAIRINGTVARKAGQYVMPGDSLSIELPELAEPTTHPVYHPRPLPIVYEDESLLVADKPAGMDLHAPARNMHGALVDHLSKHCPAITHIGGANRAGVILRVEPEISGLVLAAKDEATYRALRREAKHQRMERVYSALVEGRLKGTHTIDQPVGNVKRARKRLNVAREGRTAITQCRGQRYYKDKRHDYALIEVRPETARRHQIRVHLAWYGFPIIGDRVYGSRQQPLLPDRIFLHLSVLAFTHPTTGAELNFESALPPELYSILRYLARPKS